MVEEVERTQKNNRIAVTPDMAAALHAQAKRTGVGPDRLARLCAAAVAQITRHQIRDWMRGVTKTVCPSRYHAVLEVWKGLPDRGERPVRNRDMIRRRLVSERRRTGVGAAELLDGRPDAPDGLNASRIDGFCRGDRGRFRQDHAEYVLALWRALPSLELVRLTSEIRAILRAHAERTRTGAHGVLSGASDKPAGLTIGVVQGWLGDTAQARKDHLDYVLERYQAMDAPEAEVECSADLIAELRAEQERTGVGIRKLLSRCADLPEGLNVSRIENVLGGRARWIFQEHLDYVLELWRALPSREFVELTPEIASRLRDYAKRTGKGRQAILRGARDKPDGLTSDVIRRWLTGTGTARKDQLEYIFARYEGRDDLAAVTPDLRAEIQRHIRRTGVNPEELLQEEEIALEGYNWQNWPPRLMPEKDLQFFLDRWRALPDRRGPCSNRKRQILKQNSEWTYKRIWDMIGALSAASREDPELMLRLARSEEFERLETTLLEPRRRHDRES